MPKYRGASPIHAALLNGDTKTGVTTMMIDEGLDTGDILDIKEVDIDETDTLGTLTKKLSNLSYDLLDETITKLLNNTLVRTKQDNSKASVVGLIKKSDLLIDFRDDNKKIYNKVRAFNPEPTAYVMLKEENIKIYEIEKIDREYEGVLGEVVELTKKDQ